MIASQHERRMAVINTLRLTIIITVALFLAANAFASAKMRSTGAKPAAAKAITAVASSDTVLGSYEIQVITSEDDFAVMRCSPETKVTNGKRPASVSDIKRGAKLLCHGKWVNEKPKWFKVDSVEIRGAVSQSDVMSRVEAACHKIAKNGASFRQSPSSYNTEPAPITVSHSVDRPKIAQSQKNDEAEEPQLKITDWSVVGNPSEGGYCNVEVYVRNLTGRTITGLAVSVDFYSGNGNYVCSSKYRYGIGGDLPVRPGAEYRFLIESESSGDEWPSISGCKFNFRSRNMGDLTLSRQDSGIFPLSR